MFISKEDADDVDGFGSLQMRIACLEFDYEFVEGEGLEIFQGCRFIHDERSAIKIGDTD